MNLMMAQFYCDVMGRYLDVSSFYDAAKQEWAASKGKTWEDINNAAYLLAERQGYLAFMVAFRLGVTLGAELDDIAPAFF